MEDMTKWHVANGGLVIVHPFLIQLFKMLNYLDEANQFKNKETQSRAIYILNFIATGQSTIDNESQLTISKVMCGLPIQEYISHTIINDKEKEIANEMLVALIDHWKKLGATSLDGLRNTFLMRNGVLEVGDETYQLTIGSSGTDILLDFLPWSINLIKLPWMQHVMHISWR